MTTDLEKVKAEESPMRKIATLIYYNIYNGKQKHISSPLAKSEGWMYSRAIQHHSQRIRSSHQIEEYAQNTNQEISWIYLQLPPNLTNLYGFLEQTIFTCRLSLNYKRNFNAYLPENEDINILKDYDEEEKFNIFLNLMHTFLESDKIYKLTGRIN